MEMAVPAAMPMVVKALPTNSATLLKAQSADSDSAPTHVRSYFPEALYINPEIITDQDGRASVVIPMADSITTWRMAMLASTTHGASAAPLPASKSSRISSSISISPSLSRKEIASRSRSRSTTTRTPAAT